MKIHIHTQADLGTIFSINPNHHNGLYLSEIPGGVSWRHVKPKLEIGGMVYHTSGDNQLDLTSISSPRAFIRLLSEHAKSLLTKSKEAWGNKEISWLGVPMSEVDTKQEMTVRIDCLHITTTWYNILERYYGMKFEEIGPNHFSMEWTTASTCWDVVNTLYFVLLLLDGREETQFIQHSQIEKAIRQAPMMPYFMAYLAGNHLIKSHTQYEQLKPLLESKVKGDVSLIQGNTHWLRIKEITSRLDMNTPILDIGCGELKYAKKVSRTFKSTYYAFDIEESKEVFHLKERVGMDLHFTTELESFQFTQPVQVILTEVIEHMTTEHLKKVVEYLKGIPIKSIQVSTPNITFNEYYGIEGLRREDHLREYTLGEFQNFINLLPGNFNITGIGDTVNGQQPTHYAFTE